MAKREKLTTTSLPLDIGPSLPIDRLSGESSTAIVTLTHVRFDLLLGHIAELIETEFVLVKIVVIFDVHKLGLEELEALLLLTGSVVGLTVLSQPTLEESHHLVVGPVPIDGRRHLRSGGDASVAIAKPRFTTPVYGYKLLHSQIAELVEAKLVGLVLETVVIVDALKFVLKDPEALLLLARGRISLAVISHPTLKESHHFVVGPPGGSVVAADDGHADEIDGRRIRESRRDWEWKREGEGAI